MATNMSKRKSTAAGPRRKGAKAVSGATKTAEKPELAGTAASSTAPVPTKESPMSTTSTAPKAEATAGSALQTDASAPDTDQDDRLKRSDLIEAIANRVSLKRSDAKLMFDVVLEEIGKAVDTSDEVVVPPLGKLMIKKRMEKPGGAMLTVKLKRLAADSQAGDVPPLAQTDEDS